MFLVDDSGNSLAEMFFSLIAHASENFWLAGDLFGESADKLIFFIYWSTIHKEFQLLHANSQQP